VEGPQPSFATHPLVLGVSLFSGVVWAGVSQIEPVRSVADSLPYLGVGAGSTFVAMFLVLRFITNKQNLLIDRQAARIDRLETALLKQAGLDDDPSL
jgi:hypothetical protein